MSKRKGDPGYAPNWCIHYRSPGVGLDKDYNTCEAGVNYNSFEGSKFAVRPCFLDKQGQSKPDALPCEHLRRPTTEEIALHEEWVNARWKKLSKALIGIEGWRKAHKGKSASEVVECPACKGKLHPSISGRNGHVHGQCETPDCVEWME